MIRMQERAAIRICLIGDSQIGAPLTAWRAVKDRFPGVSLTAFGAPKTLFDQLERRDGALHAATDVLATYFVRMSGGLAVIEPDYDGYLLCGTDWSVRLMLPSINKFRGEDLRRDWRTPLSNACYRQMMEGCLRGSLGGRLLANIRAITRKPVAFAAAPMTSETAPMPVYAKLRDNGDAGKIAAYFQAAAAHVAAEFDAAFLPQPVHTLSNPLQTLRGYSHGAVRTFRGDLDMEHPDTDYQHMNAEYGELLLRDFFRRTGLAAA
jgi:hypothetical protein